MFAKLKIDKLVQAAGVLLRFERSKQMSYLRLLKMLYIADRQSIKDRGVPLLGTRTVAMKHGPLHSEALDLINGQHIQEPEWSAFIRRDGYHVEMHTDPGVGELSRYEIEKLNQISEQLSNMSDWDISELTHGFPEWRQHYHDDDSSETIPLEDVISAVGRDAQTAQILSDLEESEALDVALLTGR